jgi:hypothetical protein
MSVVVCRSCSGEEIDPAGYFLGSWRTTSQSSGTSVP